LSSKKFRDSIANNGVKKPPATRGASFFKTMRADGEAQRKSKPVKVPPNNPQKLRVTCSASKRTEKGEKRGVQDGHARSRVSP